MSIKSIIKMHVFFLTVLLFFIGAASIIVAEIHADYDYYAEPAGGFGEPQIKSFQQEMLDAVNEVRVSGYTDKQGTKYPPVPPLLWNTRLETAAYLHSLDMHENGFISHTGSDGSSHRKRIKDAGYDYRYASENVALGYTTIEWVISGWLESPGHCRNIMDSKVTRMASARVGNSWTQLFASPADDSFTDPDDTDFINGKKKPDEDSVTIDADVLPIEAGHILGTNEDLTVELILNGQRLIGITDGDSYLNNGNDYMVKDGSCIVFSSYLNKKDIGEHTLIFRMNDGNNPTVAVTVDAYTVTFKDWNDEVIMITKVGHGSEAGAPDIPERAGYTFSGWNHDISYIEYDITVRALYEIDSFALSYTTKGNGFIIGNVVQEVNYNSDGSMVTAVAYDGYYFSGWNDGMFEESRTDRFIEKNISVTAVFLPEDILSTDEAYEEAFEIVNSLFDDNGILDEVVLEADINEALLWVLQLSESGDRVFLIEKLEYARAELVRRDKTVFAKGDVGGTGSVTVSDAILVLRHIVGLIELDEEQLKRARVQGKAGVEVIDAIMIMRYIVGIILSL